MGILSCVYFFAISACSRARWGVIHIPMKSTMKKYSYTLMMVLAGCFVSCTAEKKEEDPDKTEEDKKRDLAEELQRQLAEQEKLNQEGGKPSERAGDQKALAEAARSSAKMAGDMANSSKNTGDPKATAEELERAAGLQEDTAEALAKGDLKSSAELGAKSSEALKEALKELTNQMKAGGTEGDTNTTTYKKLVNDYLRSISYE